MFASVTIRNYTICIIFNHELNFTTIDLSCPNGDEIPIEQRSEEEITEKWYEKRMAPKHVKTYNPAFDVTDHELITAIITEKGIAYAPFTESLPKLFEGQV